MPFDTDPSHRHGWFFYKYFFVSIPQYPRSTSTKRRKILSDREPRACGHQAEQGYVTGWTGICRRRITPTPCSRYFLGSRFTKVALERLGRVAIVTVYGVPPARGAEGGGDSDISNGWSPDSLDGRTETAKLSNRHMQYTVTFDAVDNEVQDNRQLDEVKVNSAQK